MLLSDTDTELRSDTRTHFTDKDEMAPLDKTLELQEPMSTPPSSSSTPSLPASNTVPLKKKKTQLQDQQSQNFFTAISTDDAQSTSRRSSSLQSSKAFLSHHTMDMPRKYSSGHASSQYSDIRNESANQNKRQVVTKDSVSFVAPTTTSTFGMTPGALSRPPKTKTTVSTTAKNYTPNIITHSNPLSAASTQKTTTTCYNDRHHRQILQPNNGMQFSLNPSVKMITAVPSSNVSQRRYTAAATQHRDHNANGNNNELSVTKSGATSQDHNGILRPNEIHRYTTSTPPKLEEPKKHRDNGNKNIGPSVGGGDPRQGDNKTLHPKDLTRQYAPPEDVMTRKEEQIKPASQNGMTLPLVRHHQSRVNTTPRRDAQERRMEKKGETKSKEIRCDDHKFAGRFI